MRSSKLFVLLVSLAGSSTVAAQTPVPLGSDLQIHSGTTLQLFSPKIARLVGGGFAVVWIVNEDDGSLAEVRGRRLGRTGSPIGETLVVNTFTTQFQQNAEVAADPNGGFTVTWASSGQDGSGRAAVARHFDNDGTPSGPEFVVNTYTTSTQTNPNLAFHSDGSSVVVWDGFRGGFAQIKAQRFDASGTAVGDELLMSSDALLLGQSNADIAFDATGHFVIAWTSETYSYGYAPDITVRRFDPTGVPLGQEEIANTSTGGDQVGPRLVVEDTGNFIVVWRSEGQDLDGLSVHGQRFRVSGEKVGIEFRVNTYTPFDQQSPSIAGDGAEGFLVVWSSESQDGDGSSLQAQRYGPKATPVGEEFQVNAYTTRDQVAPDVVADGEGSFLVVWISEEPDGSFVRGRRFVDADVLIFADGFESGDSTAWSSP